MSTNIKKATKENSESIKKRMTNYYYQPELTDKLDKLKGIKIDEKLLLEIVLWKINRYPDVNKINFKEINSLSKILPENFRKSEKALSDLLTIKGIGLPMASTILRFRNPNVFPIIDKRAYRVLMKKDKLSVYTSTPIKKQVGIYFDYVEKVHQFSKDTGIMLRDVDRLLYIFDKEENKRIKI